jgi:hypothetical protein
MQIDHTQVLRLGGRIRSVGQDADAYVSSMSGKLEQGCQGNDGFAAVATLRETLNRLNGQTNRLAGESQRTGDDVISAAANHANNDNVHRRAFRSLTDVLGGN